LSASTHPSLKVRRGEEEVADETSICRHNSVNEEIMMTHKNLQSRGGKCVRHPAESNREKTKDSFDKVIIDDNCENGVFSWSDRTTEGCDGPENE